MIDVLGVDVDMEYEVFIYNLIPKENDNQLTCFYAILWNQVSQPVLCVYIQYNKNWPDGDKHKHTFFLNWVWTAKTRLR